MHGNGRCLVDQRAEQRSPLIRRQKLAVRHPPQRGQWVDRRIDDRFAPNLALDRVRGARVQARRSHYVDQNRNLPRDGRTRADQIGELRM